MGSRACTWLLVLACAALGAGGPTLAQLPEAGTSLSGDVITTAGVMLRFEQVDLRTAADLYSRVTNRIVLPAPDMEGKVTILNRTRVSQDEAARLIEAALELRGWTIIPEGRIARLVRARDAVKRRIPTVSGQSGEPLARVNRIQTHLIPLKQARASKVQGMLSPLLSNDGNIIVDERTNLLVVTEVSSNMARLLGLIGQVDRPLDESERSIRRISLKHLAPGKMIETIRDYFKDTSLRYLPDERLQNLVLSGRERDVEEAARLIGEIDLPVPEEQIHNQVFPIQYAKATEVAALVSKLYKERVDQPPPTFSINADPPSNSVILTGPPELREEIRGLIADLDQRYRQVVLKVLIGEVSTPEGGHSRTFGIEWAHLLGNAARSELAQDFGAIGASAGRSNPGTGTAGLRYSLLRPASYSVFVQALDARSDFRTLASPHITVANNKPAEFRVGRQVPVQTAERISDNSNTTIRSSEFRDVVLGLTATPQITARREVALHLELQFNEQLGRDPVLNNPIFSTREVKTDVIVADEHTLILGGLIRNDFKETRSEVPGLARLPVIGRLFRRTNRDRPRQELLVMLTPTILETSGEADRVTERYDREWFGRNEDAGYRERWKRIRARVARLRKEQE